jgi:hypothetical protein
MSFPLFVKPRNGFDTERSPFHLFHGRASKPLPVNKAAFTPPKNRMIQLILKRAFDSRPSGEWGDDDYDLLEEVGAIVGRIFRANAAPAVTP